MPCKEAPALKYMRPVLAAAASFAVISALSLQSTAVAAPPIDDAPDTPAAVQSDNLPNPLAEKRRAEKINALNAVLRGDAQLERHGDSVGAVVGGKFIETAVTGED